jgi:hypothetical protein
VYFHLHLSSTHRHERNAVDEGQVARGQREVIPNGAIQLLSPTEASSLSPAAQVQLLLNTPIADIRGVFARKIPLNPVVDGEMIWRPKTFTLWRIWPRLRRLSRA